MFSFTEESIQVEVRRHNPSRPWTYAHLDLRQRIIAEKVRTGEKGSLLLSEVAPVITRGRRTPVGDILADPKHLSKAGIQLHGTDRGGLATYHGPGQWVLFPVDHLAALTGDRRGVRKAVDMLLQVALKVGRLYRPEAHIRSGDEMGVWTSHGKFAAVGVHVERGVLLHGLAVNGFRTPTSFMGLRPCGLDAPVDFLLSEKEDSEFRVLGDRLVSEALKSFWRQEFMRERLTVADCEAITSLIPDSYVGL